MTSYQSTAKSAVRSYPLTTLFGCTTFLMLLCLTTFSEQDPVLRRLQEQEKTFDQQLDAAAHIVRHRELINVLEKEGDEISKLLRDSANDYFCPYSQDVVWKKYPPLDFGKCDDTETYNYLKFGGGMTNGLKFTFLATLLSIEQGRCFEGGTPLTLKYFQDIGFTRHPRYQAVKASKEKNEIVWENVWDWDNMRNRRVESDQFDFTNTTTFGYSHPDPNVSGLSLKRHFMRRFWQLRPHYREMTCQSLLADHHDLLQKDYIAFSVRRGDKYLEGFSYPSMEEYVVAADPIVLDGKDKLVYVATDDCSVMKELRTLRPSWTFESQCDLIAGGGDDENHKGFALSEMVKMKSEDQEEHYRKFFVEIYAMALSKVFSKFSYNTAVFC